MITFRVLAIAAGLLMHGCTPEDGSRESHSLIIATATPGGTYYPVGVAVGTLVSTKEVR